MAEARGFPGAFLMTMDDFQTRAIGNQRSRHTDKIRQNAEQIREYTSYLLARLDRDGSSVSHYADGIASDANEIVARFAALQAMDEALAVLETSDEPEGTGTDFGTWPLRRLTDQQKHLESVLLLGVGQNDPQRPQMQAELKAVREEIASRTASP